MNDILIGIAIRAHGHLNDRASSAPLRFNASVPLRDGGALLTCMVSFARTGETIALEVERANTAPKENPHAC